jgi:hypothetical protein
VWRRLHDLVFEIFCELNSTAVPQGWWNNDRRYPIPAEALPVPAVINFSQAVGGTKHLGMELALGIRSQMVKVVQARSLLDGGECLLRDKCLGTSPPPALGWTQPGPMFTNGRVVEVDDSQGLDEIEEWMQRLNAD